LQREWLDKVSKFAEATGSNGAPAARTTYIGKEIPFEYYENDKLPAQALRSSRVTMSSTFTRRLQAISLLRD